MHAPTFDGRTALAFLLAFAVGCAGDPKPAAETAANPAGTPAGGAPAQVAPFKVGIMTGTVSQGEDEYRGGQAMKAKYGDRVIHVTYPDNFMTEQETTVAQVMSMASDPEVKAIIIAQGVPGSIAAMRKVRDQRPEMMFILDNPHEDPSQVSQYANLCIQSDDLKRGDTIIELANKMGAKTFVHYSFSRHMSQELLSRRVAIMQERCKALGMEFVSDSAPDPMSEQGLPGAQRYIIEDVPKKIARYGKDTAFFATNCGMQEPLIRTVMMNGGILPEQCCPSPTHGYPGALGIAISAEDAGDMVKIRQAISAEVAKHNEQGRMATWPVSIGMVGIAASTELAMQAIRGETKLNDIAAVERELEKAAGVNVGLAPYPNTESYFLVILDSVIF